MPSPEFKPTLYMKASCPFCLKLAAFLSEAGLLDNFKLKTFWPGDENEEAIREELAPHFEKPSFPTAEVAPGEFVNESDVLIAHYASQQNLDPDKMPFYQYILAGPVRRLRQQFRELKELRSQLQ